MRLHRRWLIAGLAALFSVAAHGGGTALAGPAAASPAGAPTIERVYAQAKPAVVLIRTLVPAQDPSSQPQEELGAGFFIDRHGDILTADHVVAGAQQIFVTLSGGQTLKAHVVGEDAGDDLALIHVALPRRLAVTPLHLAGAAAIPGEASIVVGNPFGYVDTVTAGIVSGVGGDTRNLTGLDGHLILGSIQTDASVDPGNSGGPLLGVHGQVLGIIDATGGSGIGLAIPSAVAVRVLPLLKQGAPVVYPWAGISAQAVDPVSAAVGGLPVDHGVIVTDVVPGSPAARAGLVASSFDPTGDYQSGTILVTVGGRPLLDLSQLVRAIEHAGIGGHLDVGAWSANGTRKLVLWPAAWPSEVPR